jgi:hypothetical protein
VPLAPRIGMTSRILIQRLARVGGVAALATTIAAAELFAQAPAPPVAPPNPAAPPVPSTPSTPATPTTPTTPTTPASPGSPATPGTPGTPGTPTTPSTPATATPATPGGAPHAGTGAGTPRVLTDEVPPGISGPQVTLTGCVRRVERTSTDSATIADVINRPMTAYLLDPVGPSAVDAPNKASSEDPPSKGAGTATRVTGLIAANETIQLERRVGKPVEIAGTLRSPMVIGPRTKDAGTIDATELQPVVVTSLRPASAKCR